MKTVLSLVALAAVASSFAGTYTVSSSASVTMMGTATAPGVNVALAGAVGPVRGVGVTGAWSVLTPAGSTAGSSQWSQEFGATVTGPGGTTSPRVSLGGAATPNDYAFSPTAASPWTNLSTAYDMFFNASSSGTYAFNFNQSYGSAGVTKFDMTSATFLTDYLAPVTTTLGPNSPTFARPSSLTATSTGAYQYSTVSFTIDKAGTYLVGSSYTGLSTGTGAGLWDGYMYLYSGGFSAASPLTNLVGYDDDGAGGYTAGASSMYVSLAAGTYTAVVSEYSTSTIAASASATATVYVAGGTQAVPEPASMAALGLGALAMLRRRKKA